MTEIYTFLITFIWSAASLEAYFMGSAWKEAQIIKDPFKIESAREILALRDTVSDSKIASFDAIHSISKYVPPKVKPQEGSITLEKGPMIFSESKKRVVDYSEMTSSIATKSLELVQNHLRKIKKPKFQVFHQPEHIAENLDEVYFLNMQNSFISEFRDTVKSFERAKSLRKVPYDITKFGYNELNGNKFFSMEELALRSLDYLSQASSEINGVGKTIVREVLKDKEVLEIIKSRFTNVFMHPKLGTDLYVDFEDFVKHNEWTKGISNIFSDLSKEDQNEVFANAIKKFAEAKKEEFARINNKFSPFLDFLSKPGALSEPEDEKNRLMARNLLYFVSEPHNIDNRGFYPNMWSLSYYTVESWLKNQNSIFFQLYKDEIEKTALLGKIDILKKHITLSNRADELMPKSLHMKPRKEADVWKQLGDSRLENWYNEYQKKLIQLNADYKIHYDLLKNHEKNINILFKNFSKNKENRELKDSLHINQWIHSSTVKGFWGRLDKSALSAEEGLLKRIDFSELKKTIEMNPRALTNS